MRLVTYVDPAAGPRVGAEVPGGTVDLSGTGGWVSMIDLIRAGPEAWKEAGAIIEAARTGARGILRGSPQLLAPIPRPAKNVFCVGLNYRPHLERHAEIRGEAASLPDTPLFFTKAPTSVIGTGAAIRRDARLTTQLDWEVELAVVIGRGGTWIEVADAPEHIFGYTLVNDVTARDLQFRDSQFFFGKSQDTYCPMGPALVTPEEMPPLDQVRLELRVNGVLRQSEPAGSMIFPPEVVVSEISKGITLEPGDVISLGTPGGSGYEQVPPEYLRPGDVVEASAEPIGRLTNPVVAA